MLFMCPTIRGAALPLFLYIMSSLCFLNNLYKLFRICIFIHNSKARGLRGVQLPFYIYIYIYIMKSSRKITKRNTHKFRQRKPHKKTVRRLKKLQRSVHRKRIGTRRVTNGGGHPDDDDEVVDDDFDGVARHAAAEYTRTTGSHDPTNRINAVREAFARFYTLTSRD